MTPGLEPELQRAWPEGGGRAWDWDHGEAMFKVKEGLQVKIRKCVLGAGVAQPS